MRLRCEKEKLLKALAKVSNIVSDKTTMPILSYLLMETKGNKLRLMATDLKVGVETFLEVKVEEEGAIACPAKKIQGVVRELPAGEMAIDTQKNNSILINAGTTHIRLMGLGTEDFPRLPEVKKGVKIEIDGRQFKEIIKETYFAVSYDENRFILNSLYFKIGEGVLKVVATDGRRMAYLCRKVEVSSDTPVEAIIPINAIKEIEQLIDENLPASIIFSENQVVFSSGDTRFISRLVEGQFPDYEKIIPKTLKWKVGLNREEFLAAIRRMALLTSERTNAVKLDLGKKKLVVSIINPELGEGREEIKCEGETEAASVSFNPNYLLDFLKNNTSETVDFQFNDVLSPGVFKPATQDNYLYFLMPIKI